MKRILFILSFLFITVSVFCQQIADAFAGEYATSYRTTDNRVAAILWDGAHNKFTYYPLVDVIDGDGGQYKNIVLTGSGDAYIIGKNPSGGAEVTPIALPGVSKVYMWFQTYLLIKNGEVWYGGHDEIAYGSLGIINAEIKIPIRLDQPSSAVVKIVVMDMDVKTFRCLCADGTVWEYKRGSKAPIKKQSGAKDIAGIGRACNITVTATDIIADGQSVNYVGLTTAGSFKDKFTGMVFPLKEVVGNWNTLHIIDANDNLFACGDAAQGEIGNGFMPDHKLFKTPQGTPSPYAWNQLRSTSIVAPIQIPGKWKNICASNSIAFYIYAQDLSTGNWFSWGRNKQYALGNGLRMSNDNVYPNWGDTPAPVFVDPINVLWTEPVFDPTKPVPVPPVIIPPLPPQPKVLYELLDNGTWRVKQ